MKKVSICIPYYNSKKTLIRLLNSILEQSFKDYEVIITDDSPNVLEEEIIKRYPEVKYYKNENRLGPTANCNEAVRKSSGELIKIMHHDDWFNHKNALAEFVQMMDANPYCDIAFSGSLQVRGEDSYSRCMSDEFFSLLSEDYRYIYWKNEIGAPSATIYRHKDFFFDENLKWLVDVDLYLNILSHNSRFVHTINPLVCIGMSNTQVTNSCIENLEIQAYEYKYLYGKYSFFSNTKCYKTFIMKMIQCNIPYSKIKHEKIRFIDYSFLKLIEWMKHKKRTISSIRCN